jgi:hypothetical protein
MSVRPTTASHAVYTVLTCGKEFSIDTESVTMCWYDLANTAEKPEPSDATICQRSVRRRTAASMSYSICIFTTAGWATREKPV